MGKNLLVVSIMLLLSLLLAVGCGIPQEQYDVLASDLSKAQQELQSTKVELEAAQAKVLELTSSLEATKSELATAESEYDTFKSDAQYKFEEYAKHTKLNYAIAGLWSAAISGDLGHIMWQTGMMNLYIEPIGDPEMNRYWFLMMMAAELEQDQEYLENFAAIVDRNNVLVMQDVEAIRNALDLP